MKFVLLTFFLLAFGVAAAASFDGVTEPIDQAKIGFTVPGKIDRIWVKEGAFVHKGDTLVNLVKTEEELRARITKISAEDTSSVVSARVKMETYEKDWTVTKKLYETSNSVSAEQLWEREMNYRVAKAEVSNSHEAFAVPASKCSCDKQSCSGDTLVFLCGERAFC
ncbi:hypothetical protein [Fibrobacter sp.]